MKKEETIQTYTVKLQRHEILYYTLDAASPREAVDKAKKKNRRLTPNEVCLEDGSKGWEITGGCEGCKKTLLEGDDYFTDSDGIHLCKKCYKAMVADLNICAEQQ